jgi:hypothetical protein
MLERFFNVCYNSYLFFHQFLYLKRHAFNTVFFALFYDKMGDSIDENVSGVLGP